MTAGTEGIAGRLRTEAGYRRGCNGDGTVSDMPDCHLTGSVPTAFGTDGMDIYADMPVHGLSDRLADPVDPQER